MRSHSRKGWFALALGLVMFLTTACFGGGGGSGDQSTSTGAQEDVGPPQPGGIYRSSSVSDPPTLDPHKESSFNTHTVIGYVYSKLVDFETGPDIGYGEGELEGDLAETWESSEDGTTWTFHLRQGVTWHDVPPVNGREFTSEDVVCTFDRIRNLPGQQVSLISMVESWEAPDPYTVVFNLKEPYAEFDKNLGGNFVEIVPCEGTAGEFNLEEEAIGTGPFILETFVRDKERIYVKNPDYYEEGKPYLDGIHVSLVPDQGSRIAAFRTGKIDSIGLSNDDQLPLITNSVEGAQVSMELGFNQTLIYMNQAVEPFDDLNVRRAVALAVDRKSMMADMHPGDEGGLFTGPVTPKLFGGLPPEESEELQPYDPDKAKELLAEAGYPDGFEVSMIVTDGYGPTVVQEAQWIQQDLAAVGIDVTLDVQDYATYFADSWANEDYAIGYGLQTPMLSADQFLTSQWLTDGPRNWFNISDPQLDQMITEQRGILDPAERETALLDIQRYIIENVSNPVLLYSYYGIGIRAPWVHGYYSHPDYGGRHMKDVWLAEDAPGRS